MKSRLKNGQKMRRQFAARLSLLLVFTTLNTGAFAAEVLWTQYCQHRGKMKLMVHVDTDPSSPVPAEPESVKLWLREGLDGDWKMAGEQPIDYLTATALFEMQEWPRHKTIPYKVNSGESEWEGTFRAEPKQDETLKLAGLTGMKDLFWPWKEAVEEIIAHDPDIVFFSGDQIYENDYKSGKFIASTRKDVPKGMKNYLEKYRKFGQAVRELVKDRPSVMVTDDHDVFNNDLWGRGGMIMMGARTTGGYACHPEWVNAAEYTQTGWLPDPADPGPHGDGIAAYYTALDYGGVSFAIIEDRKFKDAPSEVIKELIAPPGHKQKKRKRPNIEVVLDPDYDCRQLDRDDLQLLGKQQEDFLRQWADDVKKSGRIGAVLSQSPWAHVAMYSPTSADLDSNGWPQSGRNRALNALGDAPVVLISGDVHLGTLCRHGIENFNDGPVSFSVPAFASHANRSWEPIEAGNNRQPGAPENTGEFHDRFGNKVTMYGAANGLNGYGIVVFDPKNREAELQLHPMDEERKPMKANVFGWPHTVKF